MRTARASLVSGVALCAAITISACTGSSGLGGSRAATAAGMRSSSSQPASGRIATQRYSLGGASILKPVSWPTTPYVGMPATVVSPIVFLSSSPMPTRCSTRDAAGCTTTNWFPPDVRTPADGVLVLWLATSFPSDAGWDALPGHPTRINHHAARVYSGPAGSDCPAGASREIQANVRIATHRFGPPKHRSYPGSRIAMTACLGPHAPDQERAVVTKMLHSLRIRVGYWF